MWQVRKEEVYSQGKRGIAERKKRGFIENFLERKESSVQVMEQRKRTKKKKHR